MCFKLHLFGLLFKAHVGYGYTSRARAMPKSRSISQRSDCTSDGPYHVAEHTSDGPCHVAGEHTSSNGAFSRRRGAYCTSVVLLVHIRASWKEVTEVRTAVSADHFTATWRAHMSDGLGENVVHGKEYNTIRKHTNMNAYIHTQ